MLPYLNSLDIDPFAHQAKKINRFQFSDNSGKALEVQLPKGGFGMSRYALDKLLYDKAIALGVTIIQDQVTTVSFDEQQFTIQTATAVLQADYVIGAFGKRSNLDKKLSRAFIKQQSPWLGVKAHYKTDFPEDVVALHNFEGGYCGLSMVETGHVNACYLADYKSFKKHKNIAEYQQAVLEKNSALKDFFASSELVFDKPISISQISFEKKQAVEEHILMVGDSAGLIHPLCGNGMAMAIHSAKLAATLLIEAATNGDDRATVEKKYTTLWKYHFSKRLYAGRMLQAVLQKKQLTRYGVGFIQSSPRLLRSIIKMTHGTDL